MSTLWRQRSEYSISLPCRSKHELSRPCFHLRASAFTVSPAWHTLLGPLCLPGSFSSFGSQRGLPRPLSLKQVPAVTLRDSLLYFFWTLLISKNNLVSLVVPSSLSASPHKNGSRVGTRSVLCCILHPSHRLACSLCSMYICWMKYNRCAKEGPLRGEPAHTQLVTPHMTRSARLFLRLTEPCANWGPQSQWDILHPQGDHCDPSFFTAGCLCLPWLRK